LADEEAAAAPDLAWLLAPVAPREVRVYVAVGDGVEVTPETRDKLDQLIADLEHDEVSLYDEGCKTFACGIHEGCMPQWNVPCFSFMHCTIIGTPEAR